MSIPQNNIPNPCPFFTFFTGFLTKNQETLHNAMNGVKGGGFAALTRFGVYPFEFYSIRQSAGLTTRVSQVFHGAVPSTGLNFAKQGVVIGSGSLVHKKFNDPIVTGCVMGFLESSTHPVNTIRAVMQTQCIGFKESLKSLGLSRLYAGLPAVLMRNQIWQASQLAIYNILKNKEDSSACSLLKGEASVLTASTASFPLQRIFVEQMHSKISFVQALKIVTSEKSFFRGLSPALARVLITGLAIPYINEIVLDRKEAN